MELKNNYHRQEYLEFLRDRFLTEHFLTDISEVSALGYQNKHIQKVHKLGEDKNLKLHILEIEHESPHDPRISLTRESFKLMKGHSYPNVLAVFTTPKSDQYRLSLITSNLTLNDKDQVVKEFSNPQRLSYLLGPGSKIRTPEKFLINKGKVKDIQDLKQRFSVEVVNKEFYQRIALLFTQLVGGERKIGSTNYNEKGSLKLPSTDDHQTKQEFAVRLIGRIVFCWFLKQKDLIPEDILSSAAITENNYYHWILETLFFEVLNTPQEKRKEEVGIKGMDKIPFLNGGLFEPHSNDYYDKGINGNLVITNEWMKDLFTLLEEYNFTIDENSSIDQEISIDPEMLGRIFENLLAEINPETGDTARKSTGSFYTPRPIVDYMVKESLKQYLMTHTTVPEEQLEKLFNDELGLEEDEEKLADKTINELIKALHEMKILDPACGSGAFPMGILNHVTDILRRIDPLSEKWLHQRLAGIDDPTLRKEVERNLREKNFEYVHKLGIIHNCIYGVDIQPIAVEISKLRVFLSLVVDEKVLDSEPNRGIESLPNLEFKFVCANTLIGLPNQTKKSPSRESVQQLQSELQQIIMDSGVIAKQGRLMDPDVQQKIRELNTRKAEIEGQLKDKGGSENLGESAELVQQLAALRQEYFTCRPEEKPRIRDEFIRVQNQMRDAVFDTYHPGTETVSQQLATWEPFSDNACVWFDPEWMFGIEEGFDVVIGNPPYVQLQKDSGTLANLYKDCGYRTFERTGDIYSLFYESGIQKLNRQGHLCFITSNKWMRAGYGKSLRRYFAGLNPVQLIDLGPGIFDNATVDTNILLINPDHSRFSSCRAVTLKPENGDSENINIVKQLGKRGVDLQKFSEDSWFIGSTAELSLKKKIESIGKPLKDWDVNIYRGVLTGLNEAFIIDTPTKERLCEEDPRSEEILKPILRGRDIKRYGYEWAGLWLIFIPWHFPLHKDESIQGASLKAEKEFEKQFPAIYKHIFQFKDALSKRNKAETGIRYEWYALQRCAATYYDEFEKEKVVWIELVDDGRFSYVKPGIYTEATTFIMTHTDIKYLVGILNSKLINWYFDKICASSGVGTNRWKKVYVELIPIPERSPIIDNIITEIKESVDSVLNFCNEGDAKSAEELEWKIDSLVYELYGLTEAEITILEG